MHENSEREPWKVLYDLVVDHPQQITFHIGDMVSVDRRFREKIRAIVRRVLRERYEEQIIYHYHGGELLTRCNEDHLPRAQIGAAFGKMPEEKMAEMFPRLLELQLQFIQQLQVPRGHYYSINLESPESSWKRVCGLLEQYGNLPVNVEIKENVKISPQAMKELASVCKRTGIRIYIDDLCTLHHRIPDEQEYIILLIELLHPYIKIVKIDYDVMRRIRTDWTAFQLIRENLRAFEWFWVSVTQNQPLPFVVFESMPVEAMYLIDRIEKLAQGYAGCGYQRG